MNEQDLAGEVLLQAVKNCSEEVTEEVFQEYEKLL